VSTAKYLLTSDVARRLEITDERVRQLVAEGKLPVAATAGDRRPIALFNVRDVEWALANRDALAGARDARRSRG
jgi:hypothetical protein